MFGISERTLKEALSVFSENEKIDKVILFGSRAKGTHHNGSDIDIAIVGVDFTYADLLRLIAKIDDTGSIYTFDIIDYNTISEPKLKDHIDRVGKIIYKK